MQFALHLPIQSFDSDFIVGSCNQEAFDFISLWPKWNTLALYGPPGVGKSHLARIWQQESQAILVGPSLIKQEHDDEFYRNNFLLDQGVLFTELIEIDEERLLDFYQKILQFKGSILFCSRQPPIKWHLQSSFLYSLLSSIVTVQLTDPDQITLNHILRELFRLHGVTISDEITDYLLNRMQRSFAYAKRLVQTIDRYSITNNRNISLALAREIIKRQDCFY